MFLKLLQKKLSFFTIMYLKQKKSFQVVLCTNFGQITFNLDLDLDANMRTVTCIVHLYFCESIKKAICGIGTVCGLDDE